MGGVCCAGDPNAERGSWNAEHHGKPRGAARPCIAVPRSAFALPRSMKFPDRLPIPDEVLKIAQKLEQAGYETWCVGGAIRDNLLGLENHDFDLTTAAPPEEVRKLFKRTVPVGIEHGTVAVLDRHNRPHEVTTFRRDLKTDGRHAVVEFGVSLMDDLARRDFTINAIAYHPGRHEWRDPFKGVEDLERRLIRSVGDPNWRFQEDYLRILRALRFSARFEFRIHPRTLEAAKANVQGLAQLSAERARDRLVEGQISGPEAPSGGQALAFGDRGIRRRPARGIARVGRFPFLVSRFPPLGRRRIDPRREGSADAAGTRGERERPDRRGGAARARRGRGAAAAARRGARGPAAQHQGLPAVPCLRPWCTRWSPRSATSWARSR